MVKGRWETYRILFEWRRYGMDVHLNQEEGIIYGRVGNVNCKSFISFVDDDTRS
jgi:hypothetical protein